jgi:hypothetical protein
VARLQGAKINLPVGNVAVTIIQGRNEPRSRAKRRPLTAQRLVVRWRWRIIPKDVVSLLC